MASPSLPMMAVAWILLDTYATSWAGVILSAKAAAQTPITL